ncbi:hypothetical protein GBF38_001785 [Nibea albiflora]|uniref:Uncharacterized protein n=1 Tax=Nibea albiflora TaxID=240163 RepID=A0ACB7EU94_NIBAL|nr:hypothetical protein GBF38_001785 [Nibea albiflora]
MDLRSPSLCVCVMMLCLLGAARCSVAGEKKCKCQEIPQFPLTKDPSSSCTEPTIHFRYMCIEGYLRKAGTSNRITCDPVNGTWTTPSLECIPDPKRPPPPSTTVTQGHTDITLDIITTTVTTFTSTPVIRFASTSVTAPTERAESTSPALQVSSHGSTQELSGTSTALITLLLVMIICAVIGLLVFKKCYRRSKENTCHQSSAEEQIPMNA